eukprot:gnl/TRDRNA2_/TRDRNA2_49635_c0_seq1.p1 gnl/TRDRNA2_/TRDRNA2_49635_c0~~gnl/TRDRNA2_/TRDRNA2_49635_c0_seq1.p1  ORF type:complete len:395 (-),score=65.09 gnl/TRDRNA2_/TRDRNA2_49635_c0_seq1:25-1209(-)
MSEPCGGLAESLLKEESSAGCSWGCLTLTRCWLIGLGLAALVSQIFLRAGGGGEQAQPVSTAAQRYINQRPGGWKRGAALAAAQARHVHAGPVSLPPEPATALSSGAHKAEGTSCLDCGRRSLLAATVAAFVPLTPAAAEDVVLRVVPGAPPVLAPGAPYASIAEAVARAPAGATVLVAPGVYSERLVLNGRVGRGITVRAESPEPGSTVLEHVTNSPYEATVESEGSSVTLQGLTIRHSSPSIAQNYGIFVKPGGALVLDSCDITSMTGSALGVEGGDVTLRKCRLHDAKNHGAALYGDLLGGGEGQVLLEDCRIDRNRLDGVLVRDGASPVLRRNEVVDNGGYGMTLSDCAASLERNTLKANKKGSLLFEQGADQTSSVDESNVFDAKPASK